MFIYMGSMLFAFKVWRCLGLSAVWNEKKWVQNLAGKMHFSNFLLHHSHAHVQWIDSQHTKKKKKQLGKVPNSLWISTRVILSDYMTKDSVK